MQTRKRKKVQQSPGFFAKILLELRYTYSTDAFEGEGSYTLMGITMPRIAWKGFCEGVLLSHEFEYCKSKKYGRPQLPWDNFYANEWFHRIFKLGRYHTKSDNSPYLVARPFHKQIPFVALSDKDVDFVKFDHFNENTAGGKRFKYAKDMLMAEFEKQYTPDASDLEEYDKYFKLGLNCLPITTKRLFKSCKINGRTNYSKIKSIFKEMGIIIHRDAANNLKNMIRGAESSPNRYKKPLCIGGSFLNIDESLYFGFEIRQNDITFSKVIPTRNKKTCFVKHNGHVFNHETSALCNDPTLTCFYESTRWTTAKRLSSTPICDIDYIYHDNNKLNLAWVRVHQFEIDRKDGFHFHHVLFWNTSKTMAPGGFDINNPILLIPMLQCDHQKLAHCKSEGEAMQYIVEQGWESPEWASSKVSAIIAFVDKENRRLGADGGFSAHVKTEFERFLIK